MSRAPTAGRGGEVTSLRCCARLAHGFTCFGVVALTVCSARFEKRRDARGIRARVERQRLCVAAPGTTTTSLRDRSARGRPGRSRARPLCLTRSAGPGCARGDDALQRRRLALARECSSVARIVNHVVETNTGPIPEAPARCRRASRRRLPSAITAASGTPPAAARSDSSAPIESPSAPIRRGSTPGWRSRNETAPATIVRACPPERVRLPGARPVTAGVVGEDAVAGGVEHPQMRERVRTRVVRAVQQDHGRCRCGRARTSRTGARRRAPESSHRARPVARASARARSRVLGRWWQARH